jgi:hypothetical protein
MSNSKINTSALLKAVPYAIGAGLIANVALYYIGTAAGIMDPNVGMPKPDGTVDPITVVPVIMASILPVIVAAGVLLLINRFSANPLRIFGILTAVLALLSLSSPFTGLPNAPVGMSLLLCLMHLVVAGSVWYFFSRTSK